MDISFKQFLSPKHSWGTVGTSIARSLKKQGHNIHLCSTNGYNDFPEDLVEDVKCKNCDIYDKAFKHGNCCLEKDYDLSLTYTMMLHFSEYLISSKNKFGIWNYDGTVIPNGYSKNHTHCTRLLPSSNFSKEVFLKAGVPEDKIVVVPHGYNPECVDRSEIFNINTDRKYKILVNIQQNHTRKNIKGIFETWGKSFTDKDDVVLIAKINTKQATKPWEVNTVDEFLKMKKKYKNHAPVILVNQFVDYISDLYRACDIIFSASHIECFNLPMLEGMACDKIVIGSAWGGNCDFMNEDNSLLISGKVGRAPSECQYWKSDTFGEMFLPDVNHACELLQKSVKQYDELKEKFKPGINFVKEKYTWDNVAKTIIDLTKQNQ